MEKRSNPKDIKIFLGGSLQLAQDCSLEFIAAQIQRFDTKRVYWVNESLCWYESIEDTPDGICKLVDKGRHDGSPFYVLYNSRDHHNMWVFRSDAMLKLTRKAT